MKLDDNYTLEISEQKWTLKYSKSSTSEEIKESNDYNTLTEAVNAYVDKKMKACKNAKATITTILNSIIELNKNGFSLNR